MVGKNSHWSGWLPIACAPLVLSCQSQIDVQAETYVVKRGEFVNSVTVSGELEAIRSKVVTAPAISWHFGNLKVARIVEDGEQVEEGDFLIQFDPGEVEKGVVDAQAELEIARAELRKAEANRKSENETMEIELEITRLNHQIAQINLVQAAFKAAIDRQKIEFDLENSAINLQRAEAELENKKKISQEEINTLVLKVEQVQDKLEEAQETLDKLKVVAPAPGIAIIRKNWSTGNKFKVEDQAWPSQAMIGLPDLSGMQATVQINEMDIAKIKVDLPVNVTLDAYSDTSFSGRITEVATLARTKDRESKVKVFDAVARLDSSDEKLLPGMTISCEIVVARLADTLFIPLEAVFKEEGKTIVFRKNGGDFEKSEVALGQENDNYTLILAGLEEDDQVALSDPMAAPEPQARSPAVPEEQASP